MKVRDLLEKTGWSREELSDRVGVAQSTLSSYISLDKDVPRKWFRKLEEVSELEEEIEALIEQEKQEEYVRPSKPRRGRRASEIDLDILRQQIEGVYALAAQFCPDPCGREAISSHAGKAAEAWVEVVRADERISRLIERSLIATPYAKLISVHASIAFAWFLARQAAREFSTPNGKDTENTVDFIVEDNKGEMA